jgi:acetyl-CoA C-acetyltransferase
VALTRERDDRAPVLVGVGQWSERCPHPAAAASPVAILEAVARRAADDAGPGRRLLAALDTLAVVSVTSWPMKNPARLLAEALELQPAREWLSTIGGNSPQLLLNRLAREIAAGRADAALVVGCDTFGSVLRARKAGLGLAWPTGGLGDATVIGDWTPPLNDTEKRHGLVAPALVYPLFENAWRARRGWSLAEHRRCLGALLAPMTEIAARNPFAWLPRRRSAEEIATPGPENRLTAFPYTKYMNAILEVDQGAAVILTSRGRARALGIPDARMVFWWGGGDVREEPWFVSERPELARSPGIARAAGAALAEAAVAIGEIEHLDLYSCFPCAVELARDALGIADDDPRPPTLTGGLPYAGGPGNACTLHATAAAVERLRAEPAAKALVTGVGWFLSKHAASVYASAPRPEGAPPIGSVAPAAPTLAPVALAETAEGAARVETYTVVYGRDGAPTRGFVIGRLEDGRRFVAHTPAERALLEAFAASEGVGRRGRVRPAEGGNLFEPE